MAKHTDGPWMAGEMPSGNWDIVAENGDGATLARAKNAANAALIAAAPELLEALEACYETLSLGSYHNAPSHIMAREAIAKATA